MQKNKELDRYKVVSSEEWVKCPECSAIFSVLEITDKKSCPYCDHYFRMTVGERINQLIDYKTFKLIEIDMETENIINFPGYSQKIKKLKNEYKQEGVTIGVGKINNKEIALGVMNSRFIMGTLNRVVGEKIIKLIDVAIKKSLPLLLVTVSGGARMQEGIFSLLQMARIQNKLNEYSKIKKPYLALLTDPTMGGVTASYATVADVILGEKGATVGFAGKRVIQNVTAEKLPEDFQSSEMMLSHGFIDQVVTRENTKDIISKILMLLEGKK